MQAGSKRIARTVRMVAAGAVGIAASLLVGCQGTGSPVIAPGMLSMPEDEAEMHENCATPPIDGVPVRLYVVPDEGATSTDDQVQLAVMLESPTTELGGKTVTLYVQGFPSNGAIFSGGVPTTVNVPQGTFVGVASIALKSTMRARGYISVIAEMQEGNEFVYAYDVIPVAAK